MSVYLKVFFICIISFLCIEISISQISTLLNNWTFKEEYKDTWFPARVPGSLFNDLYLLGKTPDPMWGTNETAYKELEKKNWVYKTLIQLDKSEIESQSLELKFQGIDTYADIYVNDIKIGSSNNMFKEWSFQIKPFIKIGQNEIKLIFESPISKHRAQFNNAEYHLPAENDSGEVPISPYSRKAPYQFGWDWGPRLVSVGLWKPVELIQHKGMEVTDVFVEQKKVDSTSADLNLHFQIRDISANPLTIFTCVGLDTFMMHYTKNDNDTSRLLQIQQPIQILNPDLWWTHDHGTPSITTIQCTILSQTDTFYITKKVGLCDIELKQQKDSIGTSFYIVLNGRPIFIKGANYIPQDVLPSIIKDEQYHALIQNAFKANFNMLRVWGGGIYEKDIFYQTCLEKGILVWQDYMFACSLYPDDPSFIENIRSEIIQNTSRLRQFNNIGIWCGNNEIDVAWHNWGWQTKYNYTKKHEKKIRDNYTRIFHTMIPQILDSLLVRNYVHTSPLSNWGKAENFNHSSMHYWGVWHGREPIENYRYNVGRFMSEYGFQSFPDLQTIHSFASDDEMNMESEVMKHHQKSYIGNSMIEREIESHCPLPKNFQQTVYLSQLTQAYAMRLAIGSHRLGKGHCMGTLFWQYNDCWPGPSWSIIDFHNKKKAAYYSVQELYQPVCLYLDLYNNKRHLYLLNDYYNEQAIEIHIEKKSFDGTLIFVRKLQLKAASNANQKLELPNHLFNSMNQESYVQTTLYTPTDTIIQNHFLCSDKVIQLKNSNIEYSINKTNNDIYEIELYSTTFSKDVYIHCHDLDHQIDYNFFDLEAGKKRTVYIKSPHETQPQITIYSLNQLK